MTRTLVSFLLFSSLAGCSQPSRKESLELSRFVTRAPAVSPEQRFSPGLRQLVAESSSDRQIRVLIDLREQIDLLSLGDSVSRQRLTRRERRTVVVRLLEELSAKSAKKLQPQLKKLQTEGLIASYRHYAVVNGLMVSGSVRGILQLSGHEEVARIIEETDLPISEMASAGSTSSSQQPNGWSLRMIGAREAWSEGFSGSGIIVGIIDAGASARHEQLRGNFRGGAGSWFDPAGGANQPQDAITGHGTGVLSCAVGQNIGGLTVGIAPAAQWIACVGLPERRHNNIAMTECADWMLRVGQPDIVLNPWVLKTEGCDRSFERIVNAWRAAEFLPVFAAGNEGPAPSSDVSPANYVNLYPGEGRSLSVGAVDRDGHPTPRSSRGPNRCDGSVYPSLVAPGTDVTAAFPASSSTYIQAEGTSYAVGYVGGAAALLLQMDPEASVSQLEEALRSGASDIGPPGADHTFGYGLLNVPAALRSLKQSTLNRKP